MRDEEAFLEKEFDFSKATKNPYVNILKKQVTISLDENIVAFFKEQSESIGIPYQTLINLYLRDCVANNRQLKMTWQ